MSTEDYFAGEAQRYPIDLPTGWQMWWWLRGIARIKRQGGVPFVKCLYLDRYLGDPEEEASGFGWKIDESDRTRVREFLVQELEKRGLALKELTLEKAPGKKEFFQSIRAVVVIT